nr:unnamed protein product [Callosobruchus analis]
MYLSTTSQWSMNPEHSIFIPLNNYDMVGVINSLKNTNTVGVDNISVRVVKYEYIANFIATPLAHIINEAVEQDVFSRDLKIGKLIPIFQKGDDKDMSNYHPITIPTVISKIIERAARLPLKIEELKATVATLQQENFVIEEEVEFLRREKIKKNIVIFGLEKKIDEINAENLCSDLKTLVGADISENDISDIYPLERRHHSMEAKQQSKRNLQLRSEVKDNREQLEHYPIPVNRVFLE